MRRLRPLTLFIILQLTAQMAQSEADGPDYWSVTGIQTDSHLNLRVGPGKGFSMVGKIPANASMLENLGCYPAFTLSEWQAFTPSEKTLAMEMRWCRVRYLGLIGWAYAEYLTEGGADTQEELGR